MSQLFYLATMVIILLSFIWLSWQKGYRNSYVLPFLFLSIWLILGTALVQKYQDTEHDQVVKFGATLNQNNASITVGNSDSAGLVILDKDAAPIHLRLTRNGKHLNVRNTSNNKRLLINSEDLNTSVARQGSIIKVGSYTIKIQQISPRIPFYQTFKFNVNGYDVPFKLTGTGSVIKFIEFAEPNTAGIPYVKDNNIIIPGHRHANLFEIRVFEPNSEHENYERFAVMVIATCVLLLCVITIVLLRSFFMKKSNSFSPASFYVPIIAAIIPIALIYAAFTFIPASENVWVKDGGSNRHLFQVSVDGENISQHAGLISDGDKILFGFTTYELEMASSGQFSLRQLARFSTAPASALKGMNQPKPQSEVKEVTVVKKNRGRWTLEKRRIEPVSAASGMLIVGMMITALFLLKSKRLGAPAAAVFGVFMLLCFFAIHLQLSLSFKSLRFGELSSLAYQRWYLLCMLIFMLPPLLAMIQHFNRIKRFLDRDIAIFLSNAPFRNRLQFFRWADLLILVSFAVLIIQYFLGGELGIFGIQPVELCKILIILFFAHRISSEMNLNTPPLFESLLILFPLLMLAFIKDMSPALLLGTTTLFMIVLQFHRRPLLYPAGVAASCLMIPVILLIAYFFNIDVVVERVDAWLDLWQSTMNIDQILSGMWLIKSGAWTGLGLGELHLSPLLPRIDDDSSPALLLAETGMAGLSVYFLAILTLIWQIMSVGSKIAASGRAPEGQMWRMYIILFSFLLMLQTMMVLASNIGLMPIMGQPLPFISRGGSNIVLFLAVGTALTLFGFSRREQSSVMSNH